MKNENKQIHEINTSQLNEMTFWNVLIGIRLILSGITLLIPIIMELYYEKKIKIEDLSLVALGVGELTVGIYLIINNLVLRFDTPKNPKTYLSPKIGEKLVVLFFHEFKNEDTDCIRIYYTNTTVSKNPGFLFDMKKEHIYTPIKVGKTYLLGVDQKLEEIVT